MRGRFTQPGQWVACSRDITVLWGSPGGDRLGPRPDFVVGLDVMYKHLAAPILLAKWLSEHQFPGPSGEYTPLRGLVAPSN